MICSKLEIKMIFIYKLISGQISHFYTSWKHQITFSFLVFSGGVEKENLPEIGYIGNVLQAIRLLG